MGRVVVVGGGIAGLAAAFELLGRAEVVCLEASADAGGNVRTDRVDGWLCEWSANGFLDDAPATLDLVRRLGLTSRLVRPFDSAAARFVFRKGRLRKLPSGPASLLSSGALSPAGRLRLLTEPLRRGPKNSGDESVHDFAARRLGREAADVLVDAMVSGIHAGDPRRLSLAATFPKLAAMEREHGSLFRGLTAGRKDGAPRPRLTSFPEGMGELTGALARELGASLRAGARVRSVTASPEGGYRVHLDAGSPVDAACVVLACPAWIAADIVRELDPEASAAMAGIPFAPLAVVHTGFGGGDLPRAPEGFGFLVPRGEGPRVLGTLWTSSIFPGRAPSGRVLLTSMLGGARDPAGAGLSEEDLVRAVRADLRAAMGIEAPPCFTRIVRHAPGIPQYETGHLERVRTIEARLRAHPGVLVCGNSYRGVSVNACVEDARAVAALARA